MTEPSMPDNLPPEWVGIVARAMFYAGNKYQGLLWDDPVNSEARRAVFRDDATAAINTMLPLFEAKVADLLDKHATKHSDHIKAGWFRTGEWRKP